MFTHYMPAKIGPKNVGCGFIKIVPTLPKNQKKNYQYKGSRTKNQTKHETKPGCVTMNQAIDRSLTHGCLDGGENLHGWQNNDKCIKNVKIRKPKNRTSISRQPKRQKHGTLQKILPKSITLYFPDKTRKKQRWGFESYVHMSGDQRPKRFITLTPPLIHTVRRSEGQT